jgi:hypothetical protein
MQDNHQTVLSAIDGLTQEMIVSFGDVWSHIDRLSTRATRIEALLRE